MNKSKTTPTTVSKKETTVNAPKKDIIFNLLMENLSQLERLKDYYVKLKLKRDTLADAVKKMEEKSTKTPFDSEEKSSCPFEIILNEKNAQYNNTEQIFKITHVTTVTNFSNALLKEIDEVLKALEVDLLAYSEKINS